LSLPVEPRRPERISADPAMRWVMLLGAMLSTSVVGTRVTTALSAVHLGLSPSSIGLIIAAFSIMPLLFAVRGGKLIDRVGVRLPMAAGGLLACLGMLASALLFHPWMLTMAAVVIGLGHMCFSLGMQHAAGELGGPSRRTANFNLLTMSYSFSGMLGPPIAGFVIDHAGYRTAFAVLSGISLCVAMACFRFPFERHLPIGGANRDAMRSVASKPQSFWTSTIELLRARPLRHALIASLTIAAAWDAFQFLIPLHAHSIGLSASSVGLVIASFSTGSLVVRLLLGRLLLVMSPSTWIVVALGLSLSGYAVLPFSSALPVAMAMSFMLGMGPGIGQPLLLSALHSASPAGRAGEAAGLRLTLLSASQILLPLALGLIGEFVGIPPLFWIYSLIALCVAVMLWRNPA